MRVLFSLIFLLFVGVYAISAQEVHSENLRKLASMLQGSFSSEKQSKADSAYFDIRLNVVSIWQGRSDGIWLYVEQAMAQKLDKPYRQRVYRLTETEPNVFESAVFTLPKPLRFAGKPKDIESLTPDSLSLREGCSVFLTRKGRKRYEGKTLDGTCPSDLKNAAFATSEVILNKKMMCSWDRGYNQKGEQVWGATKGPYIFRRIR
jgi:CpeT protein